MEYKYSAHAIYEMQRRDIAKSVVDSVIRQPGQKIPEHGNVWCCQSKIEISGKTYLLRVMVNETKLPPLIVTVYRTSKVDKYWR